MRIYGRGEWGAKYAAGFGPAPTASEVWLHHSVTKHLSPSAPLEDEFTQMRVLERIGQDRFGGGISYTFVVFPSGRVHEGTGAGRRGAHTGGRNTIARAIVLAGNYETNPPTAQQVASVAALLRYGQGREGYWRAARLDGGHRDAPGASTTCPGRHGHAAIPHINHAAQAATITTPKDWFDMATRDELRAELDAAISRLLDTHVPHHQPGRKPLRFRYLLHSTRDMVGALPRDEEVAAIARAAVEALPQGAQVSADDVAASLIRQLVDREV